MTTPVLTKVADNLTDVRFFTPFDPYHYSVDNRPLSDLNESIGTVADALDASRVGFMLTILTQAIRDVVNTTSLPFVEGFVPTRSGSTLSIGAGVLLTSQAINSSYSTAVAKPALSHAPVEFQLSSPSIAGQAVKYLVQVRSVDLTTSSGMPYTVSDVTETSASTFVSKAELSIKVGTAAAIGSEVAPTVDSGWYPLYVIDVYYGFEQVYTSFATGAPARKKAGYSGRLDPIGVATEGRVLNMPAVFLSESVSNQAASLRASASDFRNGNAIDAYKVGVTLYSEDSTDIVLKLRVFAFNYADSYSLGSAWTTNVTWSSSAEVVSLPGSAAIKRYVMTTTIPAEYMTKDLIEIQVERDADHASDSCTGTVSVLAISVTQEDIATANAPAQIN